MAQFKGGKAAGSRRPWPQFNGSRAAGSRVQGADGAVQGRQSRPVQGGRGRSSRAAELPVQEFKAPMARFKGSRAAGSMRRWRGSRVQGADGAV